MPTFNLPPNTPKALVDMLVEREQRLQRVERLLTTRGQPVTSLPADPYDGQEVFYIADATNGVVWHLRYRSASSSSYKWEFVGGPSLWDVIDTDQTFTTDDTMNDATTVGPTITIPLSGDYEYDAQADFYKSGSNIGFGLGLSVNNAAPAFPHMAFEQSQTLGSATDVSMTNRITGLSATNTLRLKYRSNGGAGGTGDVRWRRLAVRPIRVG